MFVENMLISTRFLRLKIGCGAGIRTPINSFKGYCPTFRRPRNNLFPQHFHQRQLNRQERLRSFFQVVLRFHQSDESGAQIRLFKSF